MTAGLLVVILLTALAAPPLAPAQPAGKKLPRVALIFSTTPVTEMQGPDPAAPDARVFVHALRDRGWVDGQTVVIERRSAEAKWDQVPALFADVVRQEPDVLVTASLRMVRAAREATTTIPIVMYMSDPVGRGLAASLARPGGNITGLDIDVTPDLVAKRAQLLKEAVPGLTRLAVLSGAVGTARVQQAQALVKPLGITLVPLDAEGSEKLEGALRTMTRDRPDAVMVDDVAPFYDWRGRIVEFAAGHRLPTLGPWREFAESGALMVYGNNTFDLLRQQAGYVDRILRGAKPGDLPIERPSKFDFVVNRKTARALGLTLPSSILAQATEVLE
jgi:putative ABC transport system substrate-binding protein